MRETTLRSLVVSLFTLVAACGTAVTLGDAGARDGGPTLDAPHTDSAPSVDTGNTGIAEPDSGLNDATVGDAAIGPDSGVCVPPSTGPAFSGCNPTLGIECDGDWRGTNARTHAEYCTPACSASQCCSPQMGHFMCVARDAAGNCPAADLFPDATMITGNYAVEDQFFAPTSCAIAEGTLGGSGTRRLLRFDTWTPNIGTADMFLGVPDTTSGRFTYSACHGHYHFDSYAGYELLSADGLCVVAVGHKQAFCLEDFYHYPAPLDRSNAQYDCGYQGIERNWQDVYARIYDGQWIDVTGVAPGNYILRVRINTQHLLNETNYDNNVINVPVVIPSSVAMGGDVSMACTAPTRSATRACGLVRAYDGSCTAGATVTVGCSAACGQGSCTGDTIMRVCDTAIGVNCTSNVAIASNDDSGCGTGTCGRGGDCCSHVMFTCPSGGAYTVWTGSYDTAVAATCTLAHVP